MKKAGVIGSGIVGQVLAAGLIKHGFDVMIGSREPEKLNDWKSKTGGKTGSMKDAASFGDIVILAVKGEAAEDALNICGHESLIGKTIIDTTNPIASKPPVNGVLNFFTSLDTSLMEKLQQLIPAANFVKAFSCVGNAMMVNPVTDGGKPSMFICGNNENAKAEVKEILDLFGWETVDMGMAESARAIEPLCMLWCIPGFLRNEWTHAFKLVKKSN